jgi:hypothetical protein
VVGGRRAPRTGLFRIAGGTAAPVTMTGDPTPELAGARLRALASPAMNAAGDLAFYALLDRPTPEPDNPGALTRTGAILIASRGTMRVVLSDGDPVEGETDAVLRLDDSLAAPLALQEDGTLLIAARLRGSTAADGLFLVPAKG